MSETSRAPVVLLHGHPETAAIWGPLLAELGRDDVTCLSPPRFAATVDECERQVVAELAAFGEPVHLVGHDLGGGHVVRVATTHPELLRSWVSDAVGVFHRDHTGHYLAGLWRTPGVGEVDVRRRFGGPVADRVRTMVGRGMPREVAERIASDQDEATGRAVLAHYRSTGAPVDLVAAARRPGLALLAPADHLVGTAAHRREAAVAAGARVEVLHGLGHWWMLQDPARIARVLTGFWASAPAVRSTSDGQNSLPSSGAAAGRPRW
ncbi:alpha/beta fold hydrolase [Umezawaea sp. NPDC059074]|uniref:alpha/beta fold hydrolase n=1 Tax=Umezawaea sp. NPDC059074 TaxID=3346716 RepID=UPI0036B465B4